MASKKPFTIFNASLASVIHWLRRTQVGEQVPDLLFGEQLQRTFGHDGLGDDVHVFNVVLPDDHVLTLDAAENHDLTVFVSEESVEDSTIDRDQPLFDRVRRRTLQSLRSFALGDNREHG